MCVRESPRTGWLRVAIRSTRELHSSGLGSLSSSSFQTSEGNNGVKNSCFGFSDGRTKQPGLLGQGTTHLAPQTEIYDNHARSKTLLERLRAPMIYGGLRIVVRAYDGTKKNMYPSMFQHHTGIIFGYDYHVPP